MSRSPAATEHLAPIAGVLRIVHGAPCDDDLRPVVVVPAPRFTPERLPGAMKIVTESTPTGDAVRICATLEQQAVPPGYDSFEYAAVTHCFKEHGHAQGTRPAVMFLYGARWAKANLGTWPAGTITYDDNEHARVLARLENVESALAALVRMDDRQRKAGTEGYCKGSPMYRYWQAARKALGVKAPK